MKTLKPLTLFERMFGQNIFLISVAAFPLDFNAAMQGNFFYGYWKLRVLFQNHKLPHHNVFHLQS